MSDIDKIPNHPAGTEPAGGGVEELLDFSAGNEPAGDNADERFYFSAGNLPVSDSTSSGTALGGAGEAPARQVNWASPPVANEREVVYPSSVDAAPGTAAPVLAATAEPIESTEQPCTAAFAFPLRTIEELLALLADESQTPTDLVACEFSGAMRSALEREGRRALSADWRECEIGGMHFCGDVRLVLRAKVWERAYLFPPCSMTLRLDTDCLMFKIANGRAFWGIAFVLFCWTMVTAVAVILEQPDTLAADFYPLDRAEGSYIELRTSQYGDEADKFVRLAIRNATVEPGQHPVRRVPQPNRIQFMYADVEQRDRARSSWASFPKLCASLSRLTTAEAVHQSAPSYQDAVRVLARQWHRAGYSVPEDFDAPDAQPLDAGERAYTSVSGAGDGRVCRPALPSRFEPSTILDE